MEKFFKGLKLKGSLTRQKTIGKGTDRGATLNGHVTSTLPLEDNRGPSRERLPLPLLPVHADAICQLPYYHPHITSKDDLTNFMSQYSLQEGYFLLRKSFKDPTSYTITVNHRFGLKHVRVVISNGQFSLKDRSFDTFDEMVQYYSHHEIPNEEHISGVILRFPIRRPPIEFGEYILVSSKQENPTSPKQDNPTSPKQDHHTPPKQDNPTPLPAASSPYLVAIGKQHSEGDKPLQSPYARPPAPLPRVVGNCTSNPSTPRIDQAVLTAVELHSTETVASPVIKNGTVVYGPEYSKPIGSPSANTQNLSTSDPVSSKAIGQPSTNDPNLETLIGPQDERCDCGLLMREASLPLGWSVHVSEDPDTKNQPFFLSPNNETNWDLPLPVALLLSPEQQDLIRKLGFDSDIKTAAGFQRDRLITSSRGCSMKTKGWLGTATQTKTWVSCDDYESSKSLREAQERKEKSLHGVQSKTSESSERTLNGELQHPKPVRTEKTAEDRKKWPTVRL